ncbi:MAG: response regulator [Pseudomonadota bacterium]
MFKNALVVDDSKTARFQLTKLLSQRGISVEAFGSAQEALARLESGGLPDIIFMDHMMPELDGFEATKKIRAHPRTCAVPVVMCTGNTHEGYFAEAQAVGASQILSKPPEPEQLDVILSGTTLVAPPAVSTPSPQPPSAPALESPRVKELEAQAAELLARLKALEARPVPEPKPSLDAGAISALVEAAVSVSEARLESKMRTAVAACEAGLNSRMKTHANTQDLGQLRELLMQFGGRVSSIGEQSERLRDVIDNKLAEHTGKLHARLDEGAAAQRQAWEAHVAESMKAARNEVLEQVELHLASKLRHQREELAGLIDERLDGLAKESLQKLEAHMQQQWKSYEAQNNERFKRLRHELKANVESSVIDKVLSAAPDEDLDKDFLLHSASHELYQGALEEFAEEKRALERELARQRQHVWIAIGVAATALLVTLLF